MMNNLQSSAFVAKTTQLLSSVARLRLLLVMLLILTVSAEVWAEDFEKYSGAITEGDYLIVYSNGAMKSTVSSNRLQYSDVAISDNKISDPNASLIWHIAPSGSYWTIYNANSSKYAAGNGTKNQAALISPSTDYSLWSVTGNSTYEFVNKGNKAKSVNANLRRNGTYGFACYSTSTGGALTLYKKVTAAPSHIITATSNNDSFGTVSVSGTTITATPNDGYRVKSGDAGYTVKSGTADVTNNGDNTFSVTPSSDCTITINFEAIPKYTVTLVPGSGSVTNTELEEPNAGDGVTLPEPTLSSSCQSEGWSFAGWKTTSAVTTETTTKPTLIAVGTYKPASNITLYAVYQRTETTEGVETTTITTDKLTRAITGVTDGSTTYSTWSDKTVTSPAVYAGNSAGSNNSIQLRSNNSNSGVITTASGGKAKKVTVEWQSSTSSGRTLDIYGKNSAYSAASDLYSTSTQGTKLGSIVKGTSTELTISDDYEYIGLRSNSNAMYLSSISIDWATTTSGGNSSTTYYHSTPECSTETVFSVTYDGNGNTSGSVPNDTNSPYKENAEVTVLGNTGNLAKTGYTFSGWNTEANGTGNTYAAGDKFTITENTTLHAQWTAIRYTIGFDAGTGSCSIISTTATYTDGVILPTATHTCTDWAFAGWSEASIEETTTTPSTLYEANTKYQPMSDITLHAVYSKTERANGFIEYEKVNSNPVDWSGRYLLSTGNFTSNGSYDNNHLLREEYTPGLEEKSEWEFTLAKVEDKGYSIVFPDGSYYLGWKDGTEFVSSKISTINPSENNAYLWTPSISGISNVSASARKIADNGSTDFRPYSNPSSGIVYLYKRKDGVVSTNIYYSNPTCVPTYTITWENEDGTVLETDNDVEEGTIPTYNGETPTKTATAQYTYAFNGWTPTVVAATEDATYTATFTETLNKYTITWKNYDGTVLETDENVSYGETPAYNGAIPTQAANAQYTYTFKGWNPEVTTVTGAATYTATFTETINMYQVTFIMNGHGEAIESQTIAYGSKAAEPFPSPTADGYTFNGWYKDANCTEAYDFNNEITSDITLYAKWLEVFTITWMANGEVYTTTEVVEGKPITPPASPNAGDYCGQVFAGWTDTEIDGELTAEPTLYPSPNAFPNASKDQTFYAVFADYITE